MKKQVEITVDAMSEAFDKYRDFSCKSTLKLYKTDEIIDEEKSVRWNREEIVRLNNLRFEDTNRLNQKKSELYEKFKDTVCKYIVQETKVEETRSIKIFKFLEREECLVSNGRFCCDCLDDLLEVFYK